MRRLVLLGLLGLLTLTARAQQPFTVVYDKLWGGSLSDSFQSCTVAPDGSVYVAAKATVTRTSTKSRVIKYSATGAVVWSKDLPVSGTPIRQNLKRGPLGLYCLGSTLGGAALRTFVCRMDETNGDVLWVQTDTRIHVGELAVASNIVAYVRSVDAGGRLAVKAHLASTGAPLWEVVLAQQEQDAILRMTPGRDLILQTSDTASGETIVRKLAGASGARLWERRFFGNVRSDMTTLVPSGNVVAISGAFARVEILSVATGETLRVDQMRNGRPPAAPVAGPDDSYYVYADDALFPFIQLFDRNGTLLSASLCGRSRVTAVDGMGGLYLAFQHRGAGDPFDNLLVNTATRSQDFQNGLPFTLSGIDAAGPFVAVSGQSDVSSTNTKGRIVLLRPNFDPRDTTFPYRRNQVLRLGAPGFLGLAAGMTGTTVSLLTPPASGAVTVSANGGFTYTPAPGRHENERFTVQYRTSTSIVNRQVNLVPLKLSSLTVPDDIIGGNTASGRAGTSTPNRFQDLVIQFRENVEGLAVTSSQRVQMNSNTVDFTITTAPVAEDRAGEISAVLDGAVLSKAITVRRARPVSLRLDPPTVGGLEPFTGQVTMSGKAPPSGYVITLSQVGNGLSLPAQFTVPANASQATFAGIALPVAGTTVRTVSATSGGTTVSAQITVAPGQPFSLVIAPNQVRGGEATNGRVELTEVAGAPGVTVSLAVDGLGVSIPPSVTIAPGTSFKNFTMTTQLTAVPRIRTVTAAIGVVTRSATLTIEPGDPFALTVSPSTIQGGTTASGRVLLAGASVTETIFTMTKDGGNVSVPATVTVPAGALQKTFSMPTSAVGVTTVRTITATHAGVSRAQTLTLTP